MGDLSIVQWIFIGLGLLIAAPALLGIDFKGFLEKIKPNTPSPKPHDADHGLTDLVCKWECLSNACREAGIDEACDMLEEVFPLLAKVRKNSNNTPKES